MACTTSQPGHDFNERVIVPQHRTKSLEAYPSFTHARLARHSVVVAVVQVCELVRAVVGVTHPHTLTPAGCGSLLYNSYSSGTEQTLDEGSMQAEQEITVNGTKLTDT